MSGQIAKYKEITEQLKTLIDPYKEPIKILRDTLQPVLETDAPCYTVEQLREFIAITRSIREYIFEVLDTHVLTIEHLADKELCRRAFKERNKPKTAVLSPAGAPTKRPAPKVAAPVNVDFNSMSTEQLLAMLQNVKK